VIARPIAGLSRAGLLLAVLPERVTDLALPLADATLLLVAVLEVGMSTDGSGIATVSFPFFAIISPARCTCGGSV